MTSFTNVGLPYGYEARTRPIAKNSASYDGNSQRSWMVVVSVINNELDAMIIQGLSINDNSLLLLPKIADEEVSKLERFSKITLAARVSGYSPQERIL